MTELAQFLRDRYGEARRRQERMVRSTWEPGDPCVACERPAEELITYGGKGSCVAEFKPCGHSIYDPAQLARYEEPGADPDILADLDAKLAVIDDLLAWPHYAWDGREEYACPKFMDAERWEALYSDIGERGCCCGRDEHIDRALRLLALPHADHADYQESRRP